MKFKKLIQTQDEQSNRKLITFKNIELINGIVSDKATVSDVSYSAIIEDILLKELLPQSRVATYYIEILYKLGLKQCFISLMQNLSAGVNLQASEQNSYSLIRFAYSVLARPFGSGFDPEFEFLIENFNSNKETMKRKLEHEYEGKELSFDEQQRLRDDLALLSLTDSQDFNPCNYFELVLRRWDVLGNYTYTFRMLFNVVALSDPDLWEYPEHRLNAITCITNVTSDWEHY